MEQLLTKTCEYIQMAVLSAVDQGTAENTDTTQEVLVRIYTYLAVNAMNFVYALLIFIIGRWVARFIATVVEKSMKKTKVDTTLHSFTKNLVYISLLVFVIIAAVSRLGFQTTSFVAVIGAAGLAIGLALQGSLANFAAGVLLVIFKPFRVGDFIEISGVKGVVQEIAIFNTTINSPDNVRIIVANAQVTSGNIVNYTANGTRRVDLVIGVSYEDDLQKARQVMLDLIIADKRILQEPVPVIAVSQLADSSVNFVVRPWCNTADYWDVYFDLTEKIKVALDHNGISIPFPQHDVHMKAEQNL